jgi:hypothetical protein
VIASEFPVKGKIVLGGLKINIVFFCFCLVQSL